MPKYSTESIRTVALVGHTGAGKTTLAEALLARAGAIASAGSVEKGNTVCDFDPLEKEYRHSLNSALVNFAWKNVHIHLIDTPGSPDFMGQAIAAKAPIAWPMKSGDPGVSIRWMWTFFHAKLTSAELSECLYSFSSGSKSQTVLPFSTLPAEAIAPALASRASASVVLPAPVWPTSATVRMDSVEYLGMRTFLPDEPNGCPATLPAPQTGRQSRPRQNRPPKPNMPIAKRANQ